MVLPGAVLSGSLGRFVSRDPTSYRGSKWNLYQAFYVPNRLDPSGKVDVPPAGELCEEDLLAVLTRCTLKVTGLIGYGNNSVWVTVEVVGSCKEDCCECCLISGWHSDQPDRLNARCLKNSVCKKKGQMRMSWHDYTGGGRDIPLVPPVPGSPGTTPAPYVPEPLDIPDLDIPPRHERPNHEDDGQWH